MGDDARPELEGVLELRIHGISNTSPASMLDLPEESIERVVGDELASFWRETDDAQDGLQEGDRGWRPAELIREAYSWGGLARNTPDLPGTGALSTIGRALARVGWALLLPFGLANVAYWTRRLPTETAKGDGTHDDTDTSRGKAAGSTRLFALGLTALLIVTACVVAMDQVATQCFRGETARCDRLPSVFNVLADRPLSLRLVIAAVAPLALLLVLYVLSSVTRSYYERSTSDAYEEGTLAQGPDKVLLATPGFWSGEQMVGRLVRLHLCVGVAVVTLAMAWPGAFGSGDACRSPGSVLDGDCWDQVYDRDTGVHGWLVSCNLVAVLLVVVASVVACRRATDAPDVDSGRARGRDLTPWLLGIAILDLLVTAGLLAFCQPDIDDRSSLLGVSAAPTIVLAVLVALVLGGLTWRFHRLDLAWAPVLALAFLAAAISRWWLLAVAVVLVGLVGRWVTARGRPGSVDRRHVAWAGAAPGVMMGLALLISMVLSSMIPLVAGDWLNGGHSAAELVTPEDEFAAAPLPAGTGECGGTCPLPDPQLLVPAPYVLFGAAMLVTLVLVLLVVGAVLLRTAAGSPPQTPPSSLQPSKQSEWLEDRLAVARRLAGRAHRAEKVTAVLVVVGLASAVAVLLFASAGWPLDELDTDGWESGLRKLIDLGTPALATVGAALLAALVGGKATGSRRPLGLLWDLVCFLPRAAHPFGPPCYAERAVPELVGRCTWWLDKEHPPGSGRTRRGTRVVLSAHSLGAVLAVATLFALPPRLRKLEPPPMHLLSYGVQLRAYFGRIFPELLGPSVLGTTPVPSAQLWTIDPWERTLATEPAPVAVDADSVVTRLGGSATRPPRWRNLWRRTDFLGLPVNAYRPNTVDRSAEETDETGYLTDIARHSNYQRALAYDEAFRELVPPTSTIRGEAYRRLEET